MGNLPGHEIEHPMAVVIMGGLITATLMNLFVVPSLYLRFARPGDGGAAVREMVVDVRNTVLLQMTGQQTGFAPVGFIELAADSDRVEEYRRVAAFNRMCGNEVEEIGPDAIRLAGEIGAAEIRVDRHHGHTNVHATTDRVVGLDITDLTKRFLYTLGHV